MNDVTVCVCVYCFNVHSVAKRMYLLRPFSKYIIYLFLDTALLILFAFMIDFTHTNRLI